jgi:alpha-amylase/alpha-mannosidase (GH57 family)
LDASTDVISEAIRTHDPEDWMRTPRVPREGMWGDEPTLFRFVRPLNDVTNHLGAIRALRRIDGNPADRTQ